MQRRSFFGAICGVVAACLGIGGKAKASRPDQIKLVGGTSRIKYLYELEAVGRDIVDGKIKTVDELNTQDKVIGCVFIPDAIYAQTLMCDCETVHDSHGLKIGQRQTYSIPAGDFAAIEKCAYESGYSDFMTGRFKNTVSGIPLEFRWHPGLSKQWFDGMLHAIYEPQHVKDSYRVPDKNPKIILGRDQ